jgi:hypothetical protein
MLFLFRIVAVVRVFMKKSENIPLPSHDANIMEPRDNPQTPSSSHPQL